MFTASSSILLTISTNISKYFADFIEMILSI